MTERIFEIDSVDAYNKLNGCETLHPLVTVVNHDNPMSSGLNHSRLNYGLYALFLKQGDGCSIRYGREKYDYQEGTVVSFKPGQAVEVEWDESRPMPPSRGLLFHPDLLYGTQLAQRIHDYTFFDYDQREALHLSEREQHMVVELFDRIEEELRHPIDRHSQTLITDAIGLLLDYCMRYYDRQFITRHKGHIQDAVIDRSKQLLVDTRMSVSEIAYQLGFEYPQHFSRLFKSRTGMTPNEFRMIA